jgi:hypothetical protein
MKHHPIPPSAGHILTLVLLLLCATCIAPGMAADQPGSHSCGGPSPYTYSITQVSDYTWPVHHSLAAQHDPDISTLKPILKRTKGVEKFHHKNKEVVEGDFTDTDDAHSADIHIHMSHGYNYGFFGGTQAELTDHLLPINLCLWNCDKNKNFVTPSKVKNKWNHQWVVLYTCNLLEDQNWFCGLKEGRGRGVLGFATTTYAGPTHMTTYFKFLEEGRSFADAWGRTNRELNSNGKEVIIARVIFQNKAMFLTDKLPNLGHPLTKTTCSEKPYAHEYRSDDVSGKGYPIEAKVPCNCNTDENEDL